MPTTVTLTEEIADLRERAEESIVAQDVLQREAGTAQRAGDEALMRVLIGLADRHSDTYAKQIGEVHRLEALLPKSTDTAKPVDVTAEQRDALTAIVRSGTAVVTVRRLMTGGLEVALLENDELDIQVYPGEHSEAVRRIGGCWI
jgi:hypothetical protein